MNFQNSLDFARQMDAQDTLHALRKEFVLPEHKGTTAIYFLGNSLGLRPKQTTTYINEVIRQWDAWGVEAFFRGAAPWMDYHEQLAGPLSRIVGALPHEVVVMNSLTVNLHLMLASFYQPQGSRNKILCEAKAFCSDQYMLETHVRQRGLDPREVIIEVAPREKESLIHEADILRAIEEHREEIALVFMGGVNYYTGQVFDMQTITAAAHSAGARAGFDLAHATGNIPLQLHQWQVDFACWCSYKYLNAGPGAIGGAYVHEKYHQDAALQRLAGWWGYNKDRRFQMAKGFDPVRSAEGWQLSTPSPILYAAHKAALDLFDQAGMLALQHKGKLLSDYLIFLLQHLNLSFPREMIHVLTPLTAKGCQVSLLMLENGREVFTTLAEEGVFADWREPNVIRVAPVPLYNTFEEVWQFVRILESACAKKDASSAENL